MPWWMTLIVASPMMVACGPSLRDAQAQRETNDRLLRERAKFDLSCDDLTTTPLAHDRDLSGNEYVTVAGIAGCGKKATYVIVDGKWVMNNGTK